MNTLEKYLFEKSELAERLKTIDSMEICMNVGDRATVSVRKLVHFVGTDKQYHYQLNKLQQRLFREWLRVEREQCEVRLQEIEEELENASNALKVHSNE